MVKTPQRLTPYYRNHTQIAVSRKIKARLNKLGTVEDKYNDVIEMLINFYEQYKSKVN